METGDPVEGLRVPYRLETERLVLRCFEPDDAPAFLRATLASREHLLAWMPWAASMADGLDGVLPLLRRFRGGYDRDENYPMAVLARESGELVGSCGLHPRCGQGGLELGYWVHVEHVRRGYASEMAAALTRVGFELFRMDRLEIHCDPANEASRRVPEKLGYQLEGRLRRRISWPDGPARDKEVWTLLCEEHVSHPSAASPLAGYDLFGRRIV
jgi:RimJ/RimL family protein N-acetyltransferase